MNWERWALMWREAALEARLYRLLVVMPATEPRPHYVLVNL